MKGIQLVFNTLNGHQRKKRRRRLDNTFCSLESQFLYLLETLANPKCPRPRKAWYNISGCQREFLGKLSPSLLINY